MFLPVLTCKHVGQKQGQGDESKDYKNWNLINCLSNTFYLLLLVPLLPLSVWGWLEWSWMIRMYQNYCLRIISPYLWLVGSIPVARSTVFRNLSSPVLFILIDPSFNLFLSMITSLFKLPLSTECQVCHKHEYLIVSISSSIVHILFEW